MHPTTARLMRRYTIVYLGLAATGVLLGWNTSARSRAGQPPA
jgi:hypothetical protein